MLRDQVCAGAGAFYKIVGVAVTVWKTNKKRISYVYKSDLRIVTVYSNNIQFIKTVYCNLIFIVHQDGSNLTRLHDSRPLNSVQATQQRTYEVNDE